MVAPCAAELRRCRLDVIAWAPDDPRIHDLADATADHYLTHPEHMRIVTGMQARTDTTARYGMVRDFGSSGGTATERLVRLIEARLRDAGVRIPRPDTY